MREKLVQLNMLQYHASVSGYSYQVITTMNVVAIYQVDTLPYHRHDACMFSPNLAAAYYNLNRALLMENAEAPALKRLVHFWPIQQVSHIV